MRRIRLAEYGKKVPLPGKLTQRIADLSQNMADNAGSLSKAASKWRECRHF
jgi:hypothetical protein